MSHSFDVVVAGAGPAGLTFSRYLANAGFKVAVLEKAITIGEPRHDTGGSFPDMLENHGISEDVIAQKLNRIRFETVTKTVEKRVSTPAIILDRRKFARALAEKAVDAGVELMLNSRVLGALRRNGKITGVSFKNFGVASEAEATLVVDATGKEDAVLAREAGLLKYGGGTSSAFECEFFCRELREPDTAVHGFGKYASGGYAWIYPTGEKSAIVGIGRPNAKLKELSGDFDFFVKSCFSKVASEFQPVEYHLCSTPRTIDIQIKAACDDNLLCIGSVGGYANPLWNEGIRFVMDHAKTSAEICAGALEGGDLGKKTLSRCNYVWEKKNGLLWNVIKKYVRSAGHATDDKWDKLLEVVEKLDEETVYNILRGTPSVKDVIRIAMQSRL